MENVEERLSLLDIVSLRAKLKTTLKSLWYCHVQSTLIFNEATEAVYDRLLSVTFQHCVVGKSQPQTSQENCLDWISLQNQTLIKEKEAYF